MERRKRPLVYCTAAVQRAAERLMPGKIVENEVERAILAGRVHEKRDSARIFGDGWSAYALRQPGRRRSGARSWLVTDLQPVSAAQALGRERRQARPGDS